MSRCPVASLSLTSCCRNLTRLWGAECCQTLLSMGPAGSHWPHPPPCPPAPPVDSNRITNRCQTFHYTECNHDLDLVSKISCYLVSLYLLWRIKDEKCSQKLFSGNGQNLPWPSGVGFSHQHHRLPRHFSWKSTANIKRLHLDQCMEARVWPMMKAGVITLSPHFGKSYWGPHHTILSEWEKNKGH